MAYSMRRKHRFPLLIILMVFLLQPLSSFQVVAAMLNEETTITQMAEDSGLEGRAAPTLSSVTGASESPSTDVPPDNPSSETSTETSPTDAETTSVGSENTETVTGPSETLSTSESSNAISDSEATESSASQSETVEGAANGIAPMQAELFTYVEVADVLRITGFADGFATQDVVIPDEINGLPITEIGPYAFFQEQITQLTLGANVKVVGDYAFASNQISTVTWTTLPESQWPSAPKLQIGEQAFRDNNLTGLNTQHIDQIKKEAFANNQMTSLTLGPVTEIAEGAFSYNDLTRVTVPITVQNFGVHVFIANNRYVQIITDNPRIQTEVESQLFGHVVNPVTVIVTFVDDETGTELLDRKTIGLDF